MHGVEVENHRARAAVRGRGEGGLELVEGMRVDDAGRAEDGYGAARGLRANEEVMLHGVLPPPHGTW